MSESPAVSILIVNWNGGEMVRNLLRSIESTRGEMSVQTIVVDNASADGSADAIARESHEVLLVREEKNIGFARGNNRAAREAVAPYLLLLNNDTVVREGAIAKLARFLDENREIAAVGPKLIGGDGKAQRSGRRFPTVGALLHTISFLKWTGLFGRAYRAYRREGFDPEKAGRVDQLAAAALMVRRERFEEIWGFDEGFGFGVEDVDLCRRLGAVYYLPEAQVEHLGRVSSRANRGFVYLNYECGWARYLGKHHGVLVKRMYQLLVTLDVPVRLMGLAVQYPVERMLGRGERAERCRERLKATGYFAKHLGQFWMS